RPLGWPALVQGLAVRPLWPRAKLTPRAFPPFAPARFRAHKNPHSRSFLRKLRSEFRQEKKRGTGQPVVKGVRPALMVRIMLAKHDAQNVIHYEKAVLYRQRVPN